MFKKLIKVAAHTINVAVLCAIVAVGSFGWQQAQATETVIQFSEQDVHCLRQNVYFEARNQSALGQRAVAWVTLNRVADQRWPNTVCDVVWQSNQFSWTADGNADTPAHNEQAEWDEAQLIAQSVMRKWALGEESPVEDADHFHADWITTPVWVASGERVAQIDNHIFYRVEW